MYDNTATRLAHRCIETLYAKDTCAKNMGIHIEHIDAGVARLSMTIMPNMLNGHQSCHGGILFSLADTAFAYACNSQGHAAVATSGTIDFIRPALAGDHLIATASEKYQGKNTGLYNVEIINQEGKTVALFHGRAHRLDHPVLADSQENSLGEKS
ncbi:hydroxyphenylacetyl-CoA thioesterase PaaI [Xenorhabdus sp. 12]|uniref:Hydroxyphenylacetyl-CoA thioesterase PaaI n=1 Tax=Xenorhabdus santafensis TaxID=2582833 RepID=A0ABU4S610_9GAMM|nr:hydroxyphenylacetyl-CoA thioesterase PaaI [Xenorhabdus sp. 12]MDX7986088.1 hydroxyphenylacetyl-CoA thioesterase PaaI [Xenorhabdus sp. 12]